MDDLQQRIKDDITRCLREQFPKGVAAVASNAEREHRHALVLSSVWMAGWSAHEQLVEKLIGTNVPGRSN